MDKKSSTNFTGNILFKQKQRAISIFKKQATLNSETCLYYPQNKAIK